MFANVILIFIFTLGVFLVFMTNYRVRHLMFVRDISEKRFKVGDYVKDFMKKFSNKKRIALYESELYQSASLLENIIIIQQNSPKGAAYIIEQISSYSKELQKPFDNMLFFLRLNQKERALKAFADAVGTESAYEYGDILIKMDSISPSELKENISLLRKKLREEAVTREKRRNETISDLIYIPVLANVILILLNYIYVSYYAEQRELFQQLLL